MNQELQNYIKKTRESGFNDEQIKRELLKVGWKEEDVNQAFNRKSKLPIIALVAVIAIILVGGGIFGYIYLIKPSLVDKLKDWKTYSDDLYGFEFKHPENLEKTEFGVSRVLLDNPVSQEIYFTNRVKAMAGTASGVTVNIYRTAEFRMKALPLFRGCVNADTLGQNEILFGNKQASELVCSIAELIKQYPDFYKDYKGPTVFREYTIEDTNFTYDISIAICYGDNKSEDCNKFISNFKFTTPIINWMAWGRIYKQDSDWYLAHMNPVTDTALPTWTVTKVKLNLDNAVCRERERTVSQLESYPYKFCKEFNLKENFASDVGGDLIGLRGGDEVGTERVLNNSDIVVKRIVIQSED